MYISDPKLTLSTIFQVSKQFCSPRAENLGNVLLTTLCFLLNVPYFYVLYYSTLVKNTVRLIGNIQQMWLAKLPDMLHIHRSFFCPINTTMEEIEIEIPLLCKKHTFGPKN